MAALDRFFASHVPGFAGNLAAELLQGGRSNLTFLVTDGRRRRVLRRPPLPDIADLVERYTRASGREPGHLGFYLGLGYFKIAVIAEGIHSRHLRGMTRGSGFDQVGDAVEPLAAAGLRTLSKGGVLAT